MQIYNNNRILCYAKYIYFQIILSVACKHCGKRQIGTTKRGRSALENLNSTNGLAKNL